jgi:Uma2 family endonuclease
MQEFSVVSATPTRLMTFAEYEQVPNPPGGRYELLNGELVCVALPLFPHIRAQRQIRMLLEKAAVDAGVMNTFVVNQEMPYRPLPEYECWGADVACISQARWQKIDRYLEGAPELVVEVLSPSNSAAEMLYKEQICLENGGREFWVVDTDHQRVKVSRIGSSTIYKPGETIPVFFAPGAGISVESVFE